MRGFISFFTATQRGKEQYHFSGGDTKRSRGEVKMPKVTQSASSWLEFEARSLEESAHTLSITLRGCSLDILLSLLPSSAFSYICLLPKGSWPRGAFAPALTKITRYS